MTLWWSFYAKNAGPEQFAYHALWWLRGDSKSAASLLDAGDRREIYAALLDELRNESADCLLCLDGIERVLVAYLTMRHEVAPDEGATLDVTLREVANDLAKNHGGDASQAMRYLLKFVDRDNSDTRELIERLNIPEDRSEFAWFLLEAAKISHVKILVTSRFVPTCIADAAQSS